MDEGVRQVEEGHSTEGREMKVQEQLRAVDEGEDKFFLMKGN